MYMTNFSPYQKHSSFLFPLKHAPFTESFCLVLNVQL